MNKIQEQVEQQMEVAGAYAKYQELLAKEGLLDFGNQFYLCLQLMREHPMILKRYCAYNQICPSAVIR